MNLVSIELEVTEVIQQTATVKSFCLAVSGDHSFRPGQYLILTINHQGATISKPLSISSSPTERGLIEFTKRITDSPFSQYLNNLESIIIFCEFL